MTLPRYLLLTLAFVPVFLIACRRSPFPDHPDGYREFAYIGNSSASTVTVLDLVYLRPDRTLQVDSGPVALAVNPVRNEVYALNARPGEAAGSVSVIDTDANAVSATIPVQRDPTSITVDATGQRAFITNAGSNSISVLDLARHSVLGNYPAGERPSSAAIAPDGRTLVVSNRGSGTVDLFSTGIPPLAGKANAFNPVGYGPPLSHRTTFPGCPGATSATVLPDSSKAFVACSGRNQVLVLSLAAAPGTWAARQDSGSLTDHALALLDVGQNPTRLTMKPDGGEIFVSNTGSNSISEISTTTNEVGSTYAIGNTPTDGVVSPDNSALWVADSGGDSISLYSIDDGKFLSSIHTGASPGALALSTDAHLLLAADTRSGDVALIRTSSNLGPGLFAILPAGANPVAIAVKAASPKP